LLSPNSIEIAAAAPNPMVNAMAFRNGKTTPAMLIAASPLLPIPCPIKIPSK